MNVQKIKEKHRYIKDQKRLKIKRDGSIIQTEIAKVKMCTPQQNHVHAFVKDINLTAGYKKEEKVEKNKTNSIEL